METGPQFSKAWEEVLWSWLPRQACQDSHHCWGTGSVHPGAFWALGVWCPPAQARCVSGVVRGLRAVTAGTWRCSVWETWGPCLNISKAITLMSLELRNLERGWIQFTLGKS